MFPINIYVYIYYCRESVGIFFYSRYFTSERSHRGIWNCNFNEIDSNDRCSSTDDGNSLGKQFIPIYWRVIKLHKRGYKRLRASFTNSRGMLWISMIRNVPSSVSKQIKREIIFLRWRKRFSLFVYNFKCILIINTQRKEGNDHYILFLSFFPSPDFLE